MDWIKLLIPLIGLAVYIVAHLIKNFQEDGKRAANLPRRDNQDDADPARPRRTPEEIDRFLEEVRRRKGIKERSERETKPVATRPTPTPPPKRERPRPVPPPLPPQVQEAPVPKPLPEPRPRPVDPAREPRRPSVREPELVPVAEAVELPIPLQPPAPTTVNQPAKSRSSETLRDLLRNRKSIVNAILLKEIFDGPRCKRARR